MGRLRWLAAGILIGAFGLRVLQLGRERIPGIIRGKITPNDPVVRRKAIEVARSHPGEYNFEQVLDIFDYMKSLSYVSDPPEGHVAYPRDTISAGGGDCDDFAVTTASLIEAIGGQARVVIVGKDKIAHAFTEVYVGPEGSMESLLKAIQSRYGDVVVCWDVDDKSGEWLVFDTLLTHPGMVYPEFIRKTPDTWEWLSGVTVQYIYH